MLDLKQIKMFSFVLKMEFPKETLLWKTGSNCHPLGSVAEGQSGQEPSTDPVVRCVKKNQGPLRVSKLICIYHTRTHGNLQRHTHSLHLGKSYGWRHILHFKGRRSHHQSGMTCSFAKKKAPFPQTLVSIVPFKPPAPRELLFLWPEEGFSFSFSKILGTYWLPRFPYFFNVSLLLKVL